MNLAKSKPYRWRIGLIVVVMCWVNIWGSKRCKNLSLKKQGLKVVSDQQHETPSTDRRLIDRLSMWSIDLSTLNLILRYDENWQCPVDFCTSSVSNWNLDLWELQNYFETLIYENIKIIRSVRQRNLNMFCWMIDGLFWTSVIYS